ncbi:MAG: hypothetical protein OXG30_00395 [bacterium]|nr:hypothetical protein [bacterium]
MAWWPWTRCRWRGGPRPISPSWWAKADQPGVNAVELMPSAKPIPVAWWPWTRSARRGGGLDQPGVAVDSIPGAVVDARGAVVGQAEPVGLC